MGLVAELPLSVPLLPHVSLSHQKWHPPHLHSLSLEVCVACIEHVQLSTARNRETDEAGQKARTIAVRADRGMHCQPNGQHQENPGGCIGQVVEVQYERWRLLFEETNAIVLDYHLQKKRSNQMVQVHLSNSKVHQVSNVFTEQRESLNLHLQPTFFPVKTLVLIELKIPSIVPEQFGCHEAEPCENLQAAHGGRKILRKVELRCRRSSK
mmetsp:Transcript_56519/g.123596  ORF Transcript_56519/g.123596 Transcript_56519/m.123596 type:complete len:210 (-) Transcript_56519:27-656(-)